MEDLQDLLYTNVFENTDVITDKQLEESKKNYSRFREYVGSREVETNEYVENDYKESNPFNINKTLQEPYPTNLKKNHYPKFDSYIQDIVDTSYQKEKITKVSVNSKDRNRSLNPSPDNFTINFNKVYENVNKIELTDICFPNCIPPVNNYNNVLAWQYASKALLVKEQVDDNIIPVPINLKTINYSSLSSNCVSDLPLDLSNYLVYQIFLTSGFYTTKTLENQIRQAASIIPHGCSYINYYELQKNKESKENLKEEPWRNPYEEPYYSTQLNVNSPTLFNFDINPTTNTVFCVNRMEELEVLAIQTFEQNTTSVELEEYDIFYNYSTTKFSTFDPNYIYVTVKELKNSSDYWITDPTNPTRVNPYPLVLTGLDGNISGIQLNQMNYTEFYDLSIYTSNGYSESLLNSISTYKCYDRIVFQTPKPGGGYVQHNYLRFALKLSYGNLNGRRITPTGGWIYKPISNDTIIYNSYLLNALNNGQTDNGYYGESSQTTSLDIKPQIGRALLFKFIFDIVNGQYVAYEVSTENLKKRSILNLLAWPIPNNTDQILVLSKSSNWSFVHTNVFGVEVQQNLSGSTNEAIPFFYRSPITKLNLQNYNGQYYFIANNYLFIVARPTSIILDYTNMEIAIDSQNSQLNQNYVLEYFFNTGIGGDYTCLPFNKARSQSALVKTETNIFGKIILGSLPNNINTNVQVNSNYAILYEKPIDSLEGMNISILDENFMLYPLGRDFSFTMIIHEKVTVLKETHIDTKRDTVVTTGYIPN